MRFSAIIFAVAIGGFASAMPAPTPAPTLSPHLHHVQRDALTPSSTPATTADIYSITVQYNTIPGVTNAHVTIPAQTIALPVPTCIQTITPDANGYVPPGTCGAIWDYYPNFSAAVLFAALFAIVTAVHVWQAVHYRKVSAIMPTWKPSKG